ncbi:MAG TPA: ABC transporter permease [Actinomycetes bacterium]|jgi:ABC-2 type transport system permease protein|nr:ABC transporter permease [Actinomycetes bacterium]
MFRVEIGKARHRLRTWLLAGLAVAVAALPAVILSTSPQASGGPAFFDLIRRAGLLQPLTAIALIQPFFLPLAVGLLAGDAVAGEASAGTLRYLMLRPVGRAQLVLAKFGAVVALVAAGVALVLVVGGGIGAAVFGLGPVPSLSGTVLEAGPALARILAAAAYVVCGMAGLAAVGLFVSTLTDSGPGATVATVAFVIVSQILDALGALRAVHPYLLTHDWFAWPDLFRSPPAWDAIRHGLLVDAAYLGLFLAAALAVFARKDVTG